MADLVKLGTKVSEVIFNKLCDDIPVFKKKTQSFYPCILHMVRFPKA